MPAIIRNGRNYSGGGSDITKEDIVKMGFYELPEGGIPAEDIAEGVIPTIPESLPASDVANWAKQPTKPSYTASEVGALSADGKAADSNKLDGHDSDYFATATTVTALSEDVSRHAFGSESGGKNIWNEKTESGYINASGVEVAEATSIRSVEFCECKPSISYYGVSVNGKTLNLAWYDSAKVFISRTNAKNISVTSPSNARYFKLSLNDYNDSYNNDIAIIEGTSGQYEPYIASNAQLTKLADESEVRDAELRVLGWNVPSGMALKNTVENGVFTQKVGRVYLPSLTFSVPTWGIYALISDAKATANNVKANAYCSKYDTRLSRVDVGYSEPYTAVGIGFDGQYLFIANPSFGGKTSSAIQAELNGMYVYYELSAYKTFTLADYPSTDIKSSELQALGWCVPSEMSLKNTLANGVLTQRVGRVDLGSLSWVYNSTYTCFESRYFSLIGAKIPEDNNTQTNIYCNKYAATTANGYNHGVDKTISIAFNNSGSVFLKDSAYTTTDALIQALKGIYFYYELATPITHNLTDMPSQKSMLGKEWDSTVEYKLSDGVKYLIHENSVYEILADNQNMRPDLHPGFWKKQTVFDILANMSGSGFP